MREISSEIALLVCKSLPRNSNESDIDYANRLYDTYNKCEKSILDKMSVEASRSYDKQLELIKDLI